MPNSPSPLTAVGIIVARSDSSRLPRKAFLDIAGRPLVQLVYERVARSHELNGIAIATSDRPCDDELAGVGLTLGARVFRGDVQNVADRIARCALSVGASHFVRINGDSPFVDPELIDQGIQIAAATGADLVTNLQPRTYPYGVAVEIVKLDTFLKVQPLMSDANREHVTQYFYQNPEQFCIRSLPPACRGGLGTLRLTIDEPDDVGIIRALASQLGQRLLLAGYDEVARQAQDGQ
jgi:spore coat polysaccharide biosynthesis protein SpsF (cytidylyltransferase family)